MAGRARWRAAERGAGPTDGPAPRSAWSPEVPAVAVVIQPSLLSSSCSCGHPAGTAVI